MTEPRHKRVVPRWLIVLGTLFIVAFTGVLVARALFPQRFSQLLAGAGGAQVSTAAVRFGEVITLTSVTSVEASGAIQPRQAATLFWETTGRVGGVHVDVGDRVAAGQVLLSLDPESAPSSVIQAQVNLVDAQNSLEELLNPSALEIANAQNAVALARETLDSAKADYNSALNPAGQVLYDTVADAELALFQARADAQLANVDADQQALASAQTEVGQALAALQRLQNVYFEQGNRSDQVWNQMQNAQARYNAALDAQNELLLRIEKTRRTTDDAVNKAQTTLEDAVTNLNYALLGPDQLKVEQTAAAVAVAQADLGEAEKTLDALLNGPDPDEVAAAQATVLQAQKTLDTMYMRAPFDGEVLDVGYRKGDQVDQSQYAATIATTDNLFVTIQVDEIDIATFKVGRPATLEIVALPGVSLRAVVSQISREGVEVDGVVRYDVDLTLLETHPDLRLGMTANAKVVTEVKEGALAIPLEALQYDGQSEYVMALDPQAGGARRVNIVTGDIIGEYTVVVSGDVTEGQRLAFTSQTAAEQQGLQGPGGFRAFGGGGGHGGGD